MKKIWTWKLSWNEGSEAHLADSSSSVNSSCFNSRFGEHKLEHIPADAICDAYEDDATFDANDDVTLETNDGDAMFDDVTFNANDGDAKDDVVTCDANEGDA